MPPPRAVIPAAAAACLVLSAGLLYGFGYNGLYYALADAWGAAPFRTPFLDMHAVTSAVQCHRLGYDVYVDNPCDVFHRVHGYSPLWLWLSVLPITTAWDNLLGIALVLTFLAALPFLPPGRGRWQIAAITLATVSSTTMFALERANIDLLVFVMAVLAVRLRATGYAVAVLAGMLKFYPIVLLALAVRERLAVCLAIGLIALGVIAAWFALDGRGILRGVANIPVAQPFDDNVFGAHSLPFDLGAMVGLPHAGAVALQIVLLAGMLGIAVGLARRAPLDRLEDAEAVYLLVGCVLLVSCFLLAQNIAYRGIHFLFVLPALTALAWRGTVWLIVVLMWHGGLRFAVAAAVDHFGMTATTDETLHVGIWLVRELAWWAVITLLAGLLLRLVWESRAARELAMRLRGATE
jgi:hypothetical protein